MNRKLKPWMFPLRTILDILILNGSYFLAFVIRFWGIPPQRNIQAYYTIAPYIAVAAYILIKIYGLDFTAKKRWSEIIYSISCVIFVTFFFCLSLSFTLRGFALPRTVVAIALFLQLVLFSAWRYFYWKLERRDFGTKNVIIAGNFLEVLTIARKVDKVEDFYNILGVLTDLEPHEELEELGEFPLLGNLASIQKVLKEYRPDLVIICPNLTAEQKISLVNDCLNINIQAYLIPGLYEILLSESLVDQIDDIPVFELGNVSLTPWHALVKKLMDVSLSFIGLLFFLPIMIIIAVLITLDSPGPVIYKQTRVGKNNRIFNLYKFRTMIHNAEEDSGPVLASGNDSRITRLGKVLRKYRLDELPQFINVLKGEMSLVGPRPERPFFVDQFMEEIPNYSHRMQIKSGMTGLAQIAGKYSTSPEDKLRYDLLYARTYSPIKDLKILFQTITVLMMKDKAS